MECTDPEACDRRGIEERFIAALLSRVPDLAEAYADGALKLLFHFIPKGGLELARAVGRPKRVVDRR